jgi:hypothetical protein
VYVPPADVEKPREYARLGLPVIPVVSNVIAIVVEVGVPDTAGTVGGPEGGVLPPEPVVE